MKLDQYRTCVNCGHPLSDNQLVKDAKKLDTTAAWAKKQLSILADMLDHRGQDWFAAELRSFADGIELLPRED